MATADLTPPTLDLRVYVGDANELVLEVLDDGAPVDLTGAELLAQARLDRKAGTPLAVEATIVPLNPAAGTVVMGWDGELLRTLTGDAERWVGVWDVQFTGAGGGLPTTLFTGEFLVLPDVAREDAAREDEVAV